MEHELRETYMTPSSNPEDFRSRMENFHQYQPTSISPYENYPIFQDNPPETNSIERDFGSRGFAATSSPGVASPLLHRTAGVRLQSTFRQFFWTWLLAFFAACWITFTIYFAYNCTLEKPLSTTLIFSSPDNTLLALNILSHGTILFLKELTSAVFEAVRWAFASSNKGIPAYSFLSLGRATNLFGILILIAGKEKNGLASKRDIEFGVFNGTTPFICLPNRMNILYSSACRRRNRFTIESLLHVILANC